LIELFEGLKLMLLGMGIVFLFLFILIIYMKFVPILSRLKQIKLSRSHGTVTDASNTQSDANQKLQLNSIIDKLPAGEAGVHGEGDSEMHSEVTIAAIAAAVCAHSGKKPKQIVITSPTGRTQQINLWAAAGRQDIMLTRDITGQVGFQY
jgi:Na+-transporting methylmalonyl-CoA/oxaloacetate decarboxylase gamma subunit